MTCALSVQAQSSPWHLEGMLNTRGMEADGASSWMVPGQYGKLSLGENDDLQGFAFANLSVAYQPSLYFKAYVQALARWEPDDYGGSEAGIVEAYLEARRFVGSKHRFRFRLGSFFPPTSMENTAPLWMSPYTLTYSSLNSWIAEEVRFTGLDLGYVYQASLSNIFFAGLTAFTGNDTTGALLAWRGFSVHDRLTVLGEVLPLPNLASLAEGGGFYSQRDRGTQPFGDDLDDRVGLSGRLGWERPGAWLIQLTAYDNFADRRLHKREYAWETRYLQAGIQAFPHRSLDLSGEFMKGETGMGPRTSGHAQVDFETWYLLGSWQQGPWRATLRYEQFETRDVDKETSHYNVDLNDEEGETWTIALFYKPAKKWRIGLEYLELENKRAMILRRGRSYLPDGDSLILDLRYQF